MCIELGMTTMNNEKRETARIHYYDYYGNSSEWERMKMEEIPSAVNSIRSRFHGCSIHGCLYWQQLVGSSCVMLSAMGYQFDTKAHKQNKTKLN